jgi:2-dehydro-3-deoxygluconokinase
VLCHPHVLYVVLTACATLASQDWASIFAGKTWFHWTGITPALGDNVAAVVEEACVAARAAGCTISCDFNFRAKLWSPEKAQAVMKPLMKYVDVAIGGREDPRDCLGFTMGGAGVLSGKLDPDAFKPVLTALAAEFGFRQVAMTLREGHSADFNDWSACLYDAPSGAFHVGPKLQLNIVDRVGALVACSLGRTPLVACPAPSVSPACMAARARARAETCLAPMVAGGGDAFTAGLIYGLLREEALGDVLSFAVSASALAHTVHGDFNLVSEAEVRAVAAGNTSGRVQR